MNSNVLYSVCSCGVTDITLPMPAEHPRDEFIPLTQQSDAALFLALQNGQPEALGILYDRHAALVYGSALHLLKNSQEAEDLTQDIFMTLVQGCSYDPKRGTLRTFLAILTRSRAIDRLRSRNKARDRLTQDGLYDVAAPNTPTDHVVQVERSKEVQAALAMLPEHEQQVLRMAYYEGLSQSEIAQRLDLSLGTVKSRARRGLLKLRHTLADFIGKS